MWLGNHDLLKNSTKEPHQKFNIYYNVIWNFALSLMIMGCGSSVATEDLRKNSENFGAEKLNSEKHPTNRSSNTFSESVFRKNSIFF